MLCLALAPATICAADDDLLHALKAAYIYNFTRFIGWPEMPAGEPFMIGVIGDPEMASQLRTLERDGKTVGGRPIAIRTYANPAAIRPSQILFIGADAERQLAAIVRRTAGQPTVLVGDTPGYAGRGVAIEFFRKRDVFRETERLRFRIDPAALKGRGIKVSAHLYDVAEVLP